jgi:hypothetical protein
MALLNAKQVNKLQSAFIQVAGQAVTNNSASVIVTAGITTALLTAGVGEGGVGTTAVPVQVSTGTSVLGVITTAPHNRVEIYNATTKGKYLALGEEVYGRLTEAAGVYTLSFFTFTNAGVETAYTMTPATTINYEIAYRFDFARFPVDGAIGVMTRNVEQDINVAATILFVEPIAVTAVNTLAPLTRTPIDDVGLKLIVNGHDQFPSGATPEFTRAALALTWSPANAGFALATTDEVFASYITLA